MTKDNEDALGLAESCMECHEPHMPEYRMAAHLRRLVAENEALRSTNAGLALVCRSWKAENEAKDALLRQAVEAMEKIDMQSRTAGFGKASCGYTARQTAAAIRQHLEGRA